MLGNIVLGIVAAVMLISLLFVVAAIIVSKDD